MGTRIPPPPVRRLSPKYLSQVYVLGIVETGPIGSAKITLVGTAFAVTSQKLLTAYHDLLDDDEIC